MSAEDRTLSDPYAHIETIAPAHVWTADEDAYLREHYDGTAGKMRAVGNDLGIAWYAVRDRALALGLKNPDEAHPNGSYRIKHATKAISNPESRQCIVCGRVFTPKKPTQEYCSRACSGRDAHNRRKRKMAEQVEAPAETPAPFEFSVVRSNTPPIPLPTPQPPKAATYMIFADIIELLPQSRTWTTAERQRWVRMLLGVLDYLIEVGE